MDLPQGNQSSANDMANMQFLQQQVQQSVAMAVVQDLVDACFKKCVTKPDSSLSNSQKKCIAHAMDRYFDATGLIEKTMINRIIKEQGSGGSY